MPGGSCSHFAPQRQPRSWRSAVKSFRKSCICRLYREHPWDRRTGCRNLFQSTVSICSERTAFQRKEQTAPEGSLQRRAVPHIHAADMRRRACCKHSRPRFIRGIPPCTGVWPSFACMRSDRTSQTARLQLFSEGILTKDNFATSNQGCLLDKAGRSAFYPAYEKAAPAWRSVLRKSALGLAERLVADFRNSQFRMPAYGQGK